MPGTTVLRLDFEPGLPRLLGSTKSGELERRLRDRIELERLRKETDNDLAELKVEMAWLAEHCEQSAPDDAYPWLAEAAERAREKEEEAEEHFRPVIAALKSALKAPDDRFEAEVQQLLRDGVEVLEGWLAFYHGFRSMLARQAEELGASHRVLRARPVEGEVDYAELSREHLARYPKIRAALAE
jgi:RNase P protein component